MRFFLLLVLSLSTAFPQTLYVASATSMRPFLQEIARHFESEHPEVRIKLSYGSSGGIYSQILAGAPYDVFISANTVYPRKLVEGGRARILIIFARGRLALFSKKGEASINLLEKARRIAIANPLHAPYGRAAVEFLTRTGFYESTRKRLIYGSNVGQAFQFVASGGAEVGIVSLSLAMAYGKGSYQALPEDFYGPIEHVAVITDKGYEKRSALEFVRFLTSEKALPLLKKFGFGVP